MKGVNTSSLSYLGQRVGVSEAKWRKWNMVLQTSVSNQNMTVLEALLLWKQNADRRFEGIEDCPICYSVIQLSDRSLPNQTCKTCKHKFHSLCLVRELKGDHSSLNGLRVADSQHVHCAEASFSSFINNLFYRKVKIKFNVEQMEQIFVGL
jgi:hypothetical protein